MRGALRLAQRSLAAVGLAGAAILLLLTASPGQLETGGAGWTERSWTHSWVDGAPLWPLLAPALFRTATLVVPVLLLTVVMARSLALAAVLPGLKPQALPSHPEGEKFSRMARALIGRAGAFASVMPLFLLGYLVILGVNRGVAAGLRRGLEAPAWFALPLGDGRWHLMKWGLEVAVLVVGDGLLGLAINRLGRDAAEIAERPYVLAAEVNSGVGAQVLRGHLGASMRRLSAALLPLTFGGAVVVESLFQEPGAGRLLVERLAERDLPVVGAIVASSLVLAVLGQAVSGSMERARPVTADVPRACPTGREPP